MLLLRSHVTFQDGAGRKRKKWRQARGEWLCGIAFEVVVW